MHSFLKRPKRWLRFGIYATVILTSVAAFFWRRDDTYVVFPATNKSQFATAYDDREQKGNSRAYLGPSEDTLQVTFCLGDQYAFHYTGVGFALPDSFDLGTCNTLFLSVSVPTETNLNLLLSEHQSQATALPVLLQHATQVLTCVPGRTNYTVALSDFKAPDWWLKMASKKTAEPFDWSNFNVFAIQNDPLALSKIPISFQIAGIRFGNRHFWLLYLSLGCLLGAVVLELLLIPKKKALQIQYVPIGENELATDDPWQTVSYFIGQHYREDIDLELVFKQTGIGKHRISSLVKENTSMNFRQYVNFIRIQEAERLFNTTSLSVTEIGYEVGYSSATQFNRVFREVKGMAPSEYRPSKA